MLKHIGILAAIGLAALTTQVSGQVTVMPSPATDPVLVGSKWRITFGGTDAGNYTIRGNVGIDVIEWIRVTNNTTINLTIGDDESLESIEEVRRTGGTRTLNITSLVVTQDLGPAAPSATQVIEANNFNSSLDVGGSVLTRISTVGPTSSNFSGARIVGDLRGSIINDYGPIESITVGGSIIGTETDPVIIGALRTPSVSLT